MRLSAYDDANRPESLIDPFGGTILFAFDLADRLTSKTFPNGVTTTLGYDSCSELTGVTTATSGNATLTSSSYGYDYAGNVTTRTDSDGTTASFFYNGADQLTFENYLQSGNSSYIGYTYDHNGNRATQSNSGTVTSYAYDAGDKLTSDSNGNTYSYDGNGNWTQLAGSASTYHFVYDAENRLDYYAAPSMSSAYSYNGMGLRVAESDSGTGERDLINDGAAPGSSLLVDHNITARTVAHVYTPGLEQRDGLGGPLHLFGVDALGSVRALINDDGGQAVTATQGYYGYGITRSRTGSDAFTFGFAGAEGYQTDPNQLMLLGNREYHPFTGRFLTRDPAGAGDNDYEYADDSPTDKVDPSGLYPQGVTDHPGPANNGNIGSNDWYDGDTFSLNYGSAGSGKIILWWFAHGHGNGTTTTAINGWRYHVFTLGNLLSPFYWAGQAGPPPSLWSKIKTGWRNLHIGGRVAGLVIGAFGFKGLAEGVINWGWETWAANDRTKHFEAEQKMVDQWAAHNNVDDYSKATFDTIDQKQYINGQIGSLANTWGQVGKDGVTNVYTNIPAE